MSARLHINLERCLHSKLQSGEGDVAVHLDVELVDRTLLEDAYDLAKDYHTTFVIRKL